MPKEDKLYNPEQELVAKVPTNTEIQAAKADKYKDLVLTAYEHVMWAGVIPTHRCTFCQHCDEDEDEMILHVLKHVDKRKMDVNIVFDQLVAAKEARFPNSKKESA